MRDKHIIKINTKGGIYTPKDLLNILQIAELHDVKQLNFGPRQEIFFNVHREKWPQMAPEMETLNIDFECDTDHFPNIVSSYPAEGVLTWNNWLSEGVYKDIFYLLDYKPRLKVNICDYNQSLTPFFTGNLNFIASEQKQYWYLYIRLGSSEEMYLWKHLIYTTDIPKIILEIEEQFINHREEDIAKIESIVHANLHYLSIPLHKPMELPRYVFPYYEGMNRYGDRYWLGVYRRNFQFQLPFLKELCSLCMNTHLAQICITTWRSLLIKGITQEDRIYWERLLGKYNINLRHSSNELNWVIEDINSDEIKVKQTVSDFLNKIDARTFGLTFGVSLDSKVFVPSNVIIVQKPYFQRDNIRLFSRYDVYYREKFNPNHPEKINFAKNVLLAQLSSTILELAGLYYQRLTEEDTERTPEIKVAHPISTINQSATFLHQCTHCRYVYLPDYGEPDQKIEPGVIFDLLPDTFVCPVCGSTKTDFELVSEAELMQFQKA